MAEPREMVRVCGMNCSIEDMLAHSYRDFHVKGFDYICLKRSQEETIKLYIFEDEVANSGEVVNPHDHRYDFHTDVLAGCLVNKTYVPDCGGVPYRRFNYATPLNGGNGFSLAGMTALSQVSEWAFARGERCYMLAEQIHTIQVLPGTVLKLTQGPDRNIPVSSTYARGATPPSLDGLYNRFTEGQLMDRLRKIQSDLGWTEEGTDRAPRLYSTVDRKIAGN
jgi:hypothetical protein